MGCWRGRVRSDLGNILLFGVPSSFSFVYLPQFGFDGSDIYETRRDTLLSILHSNPLAPYVIRALQFGSEPLFDYVLTPSQLATEVRQAKEKLKELGIPVVVSEMAYGYQAHTGSQVVLDAQDYLAVHMLPYFSQQASTGTCFVEDNHWLLMGR